MYTNAIINFFNWNGRINRRQYLVVWIIFILSLFGIVASIKIIVASIEIKDIYFIRLFFLLLIPSQIKRAHDMDYSGWWLLWGFIPLVGAIISGLLFIGSGTKGRNKYGDLPENETPIVKTAVSAGIQKVSNTLSDTIKDINFRDTAKDKEILTLKRKLQDLEIQALEKRIRDLENNIK